jgi:hypothetical protein
VGSANDGRVVRAESTGADREALGLEVAQRLLSQGARDFIDAQ